MVYVNDLVVFRCRAFGSVDGECSAALCCVCSRHFTERQACQNGSPHLRRPYPTTAEASGVAPLYRYPLDIIERELIGDLVIYLCGGR